MFRIIFTGLVLCMLLSNCKKDKNALSNCKYADCIPVSFKAQIIPILTQNCATSNACHLGANAGSSYLNLDSLVAYTQVIQADSRYIIAGNADNSILYDELSPGVSQHMPVNGQLDACDIQEIFCWIQQGALNN